MYSACGTVIGGRYIIKVVTTNHHGLFPANAPGYLTSDSTATHGPGQLHVLVTSKIASAHVYTFDATTSCSVLDLTIPGAKIRSAPGSVLHGGSVTIESSDAANNAHFEPYRCKADRTGTLTCTILETATNSQRILRAFYYDGHRSAGSVTVRSAATKHF